MFSYQTNETRKTTDYGSLTYYSVFNCSRLPSIIFSYAGYFDVKIEVNTYDIFVIEYTEGVMTSLILLFRLVIY